MRRETQLALRGFTILSVLVAACEDAGGSASVATPPPAPPPVDLVEPTLPTLDLQDQDFVESDVVNRDPFRSYEAFFQPRMVREEIDRVVVMSDTGVDEMTLIALVTNIPKPRAMILDANGRGHVVTAGDFIGRSEWFSAGGEESLPVALNWRVDRVRDNEVILIRENPAAPNQPPQTRVMPLHENPVSGSSP